MKMENDVACILTLECMSQQRDLNFINANIKILELITAV